MKFKFFVVVKRRKKKKDRCACLSAKQKQRLGNSSSILFQVVPDFIRNYAAFRSDMCVCM